MLSNQSLDAGSGGVLCCSPCLRITVKSTLGARDLMTISLKDRKLLHFVLYLG